MNDEQQKNNDEESEKNGVQQPSDKSQEDGERQSNSEHQGINEDNNQPEAESDNLTKNDAEKQEGSQQNEIDLSPPDDDSCTKIKAIKVGSGNTHKENGTAREESYHQMVPLYI